MSDRFIRLCQRHRRLRALIAISAAVAMLAGAGAASAATYTVTTTGDPTGGTCSVGACSLRQAIAAASTGDTVILPAASVPYRLAQGPLIINTGITIEGAGPKLSVISGGGTDRVMVVYGSAAPVRLEGLTITGGDTTASGKSGGGIAAAGPGPLVLDDVDVTGNTVDTTAATGDGFDYGGGGIYSSTSLLVEHSTISDNTVNVPASAGDAGGGGIFMAQTSDYSDNLTLIDSTVSHNTVTVTPDGVSGTDANGGGGIYNDGGDLTISASVIEDNTANISTATANTPTPTDGGGGIFQFGNQFLLEDSTVAGNLAHGPGVERGGGGGILDSGNGSQYLNSTIVDNSTDEPASTNDSDSDGGGGVLLNNVKDGVTLANVTIDGNDAGPAVGGGINVIADNPTALEMTDSILAENTAAGGDDNCAGTVSSLGYNLTSDTSANNTCSLSGTGDIFGVNPDLGALANQGGPTPTQALLSGSRAINRGAPGGCTDLMGGVLRTDQRGVPRPTPRHGRCDIGAYEVADPAIRGTASSRVRLSSVRLTASINTEGQQTRYWIQYAPAAARGWGSHTRTWTLNARTRPWNVSLQLGRLRRNTTYRFRVVAGSVAGRTYGPAVYFTTQP